MRTLPKARTPFSIRTFDWDFLGFGLCRAWISLVFVLPVPGLFAVNIDERLWLFLPGAAACLALCIASRKAPSPQVRTLSLLAAGAFSILGVPLTYAGIEAGWGLPAGIGLSFVGIGAGLAQTLWGDKMASLSPARTDLHTVCAMLFAAILTALSRFGDSAETALLAFVVLPLGSFALLYRGFDAGTWSIAQEGKDKTTPPPWTDPPHLGRLCLSIFAFTLVFNLVNTSLPPFLTAAGEGFQSARNLANAGVTLALLCVVVLRGRISRMSLYRLSFPVLFGSLLLMLVLPGEHTPFASFAAASGYKLFDVLFWCVIVGLAHDHRPRSWQTLGLGMAANFGGMGLGVGLHGPLIDALSSGVLDPTLVVCAAMFALAVVTMLILPERLIAQVLPLPAKRNPPETPTLAQRCAEASRNAGLTARESEVLLLLAQGRTQSVIARKLGIGEGTAHSHIIHVYQKMNVHSQQELLDIIEEFAGA